jgi:hypothetical protein
VAKEIGVTPRTLYGWRKEPRFAAEVSRRSIETMDAGALRACDLMICSSDLVSQSLRGEDRFRWAFRVMSSKRMWEMCQQMPDAKAFAAAAEHLSDEVQPADAITTGGGAR